MQNLKADLIKIYQNERWLLILMIFNIVLSLVLLTFSITTLNPNAPVIKTGYGDISGYRDGSWIDMLSFSVLAIILGFFHGLLAIRIFHKRGSGMAKFFLVTTTALILGTFMVIIRLLGES